MKPRHSRLTTRSDMKEDTSTALGVFVKSIKDSCDKFKEVLDSDSETHDETQGTLYAAIENIQTEVSNAERAPDEEPEDASEANEDDE